MDNQIFKELATAFENATDFSYEFTVAKNGKKSVIISSLDISEFTHIVGLEHIPIIKTKVGNNSVLKRALFEQMIRNDFTYSNLTAKDIDKLNEPIPNTYNSQTMTSYSIIERINKLLSIDSILDNAYRGNFYKWNNKLCRIQLSNGKMRNTSINADYVIKIPSSTNADENYYFFMIQSNKYDNKKGDPIKLFIISAFADCIDLTRGQEHPYTILQEIKENIRSKEKEVLYTHPSYKKSLEQHSVQSQQQQNENIKQIKFDNPTSQNILHNNSGAAAAVLPAPNPFKNLIDRLKNIFKKQDKHVEKEVPVQTNDKINISENKTIVNESPVPKELTALIEAREAFAAGNLPQAEYEQAVSKYMYSLHGREMWTEAAESFRKQLEECPDNMKKYIGYELKSIELNIEKKFSPQRQQTLAEIKSAAHEQYVKLQTENKAAEKEITTERNKSER